MNPIKTISYSKYSLFNQCAKKFKYIYIDKLKEPPSEILERGTKLHKEMEDYIRFSGMPVPECAKDFEPFVKALQGMAIVEDFWNAGPDFKPLPSFHSDILFVGKVDAHVVIDSTLLVVDWKTGKVRDKQMDQLELYGLLGLHRYPDVKEVELNLVYLDHDTIVTHIFTRSELPRLEAMWSARIKPFQDALEFPASVTALCGWCSFSNRHFKGPCLEG